MVLDKEKTVQFTNPVKKSDDVQHQNPKRNRKFIVWDICSFKKKLTVINNKNVKDTVLKVI